MTNNDALSQIGIYLFGKSDRGTDCGRVIPGERWDAWYRSKGRDGKEPVQIRISMYETSPETWIERTKVKNSGERLQDPSKCVNISIVFLKEDHDDSEDCPHSKMCKGCTIHPCPYSKLIKPCETEVLNGRNESGESFTVIEYRYHSEGLSGVHIRDIGDSIVDSLSTGEYKDPLLKTSLIIDYNHITNTDQGRNLVTYLTKYGLDGEVLEWAVKLVAETEICPIFFMREYQNWGKRFILYCKETNKEIPPITIYKSYGDLCLANDEAMLYLVTHGLAENKVIYHMIPYDDVILTEKIFPVP